MPGVRRLVGETTPRPLLPPNDAGLIRDWVARLLADLLELFRARMIAFALSGMRGACAVKCKNETGWFRGSYQSSYGFFG